jgi:hypothetical protein
MRDGIFCWSLSRKFRNVRYDTYGGRCRRFFYRVTGRSSRWFNYILRPAVRQDGTGEIFCPEKCRYSLWNGERTNRNP